MKSKLNTLAKEVQKEVGKEMAKGTMATSVNTYVGLFLEKHLTSDSVILQQLRSQGQKGQRSWYAMDEVSIIHFKAWFKERLEKYQPRPALSATHAKARAEQQAPITGVVISVQGTMDSLKQNVETLRELGWSVDCSIQPPAQDL